METDPHDEFDDRACRSLLARSKSRPNKWPQSISEMRGHVVTGGQQGLKPEYDTKFSELAMHRAGAARTAEALARARR